MKAKKKEKTTAIPEELENEDIQLRSPEALEALNKFYAKAEAFANTVNAFEQKVNTFETKVNFIRSDDASPFFEQYNKLQQKKRQILGDNETYIACGTIIALAIGETEQHFKLQNDNQDQVLIGEFNTKKAQIIKQMKELQTQFEKDENTNKIIRGHTLVSEIKKIKKDALQQEKITQEFMDQLKEKAAELQKLDPNANVLTQKRDAVLEKQKEASALFEDFKKQIKQ